LQLFAHCIAHVSPPLQVPVQSSRQTTLHSVTALHDVLHRGNVPQVTSQLAPPSHAHSEPLHAQLCPVQVGEALGPHDTTTATTNDTPITSDRIIADLYSTRAPSLEPEAGFGYVGRTMKRAVCMFCLVSAAACVNAKKDPPWAKMPEGGTSGESTVTGAPMGVPRFATPPTLDGKLDDAVWAHAATTSAFVEPGNGNAAPGHEVAAFAKLGWDEKSLYVGAVVFDRSPFSPFTRDDVDPHDWEKSSALELMIQPGDPGDNRDYYEIQVDVHGAIFDSHWDDYNKPITNEGAEKIFGHMNWSCHAERAIYLSDNRFYSEEIAIPWSAFVPGRSALPPKPGDVWRINLYSFKDGQRSALAWSPIRGQGNFHKSSRFGRVRFE